MKHLLIFSLLFTVSCSKDGETSGHLLDRASNSDISAIRLRLAEERERRLLLENDVQLLTLRYAQQQRMLDQAMSPVGFVAKLSSQTTIQNGEVLKLDKVDMNEGNGYNPANGVFRAPVKGMYMLSITAMTRGEGNPVHIVLMNGVKELTRLFAGDIASGRMVGAVTVPAILSENDLIFIKAIVSHAGFYGQYFTSFTGLLIQRVA
ncbi:hypothetical protein CHS0354_038761 [Potamilus streckersoni]|uniref:C1q domain-containing protein n=1 Tax=Potamilus streckersoni TaxID=2493646 RepID=A0AAE0W0B6_9BIVA|nr:hypothetical protein CHS0354_038761 [Potamilus streckersoni]